MINDMLMPSMTYPIIYFTYYSSTFYSIRATFNSSEFELRYKF